MLTHATTSALVAAVININAELRFGLVSDRTHHQLTRDGPEPSRRTERDGYHGGRKESIVIKHAKNFLLARQRWNAPSSPVSAFLS